MAAQRRKFSSRVSEELLAAVRDIACSEGRPFQAVLEEAMAKCVESKTRERVRPEVMAHYRASVDNNRELYELLAQ